MGCSNKTGWSSFCIYFFYDFVDSMNAPCLWGDVAGWKKYQSFPRNHQPPATAPLRSSSLWFAARTNPAWQRQWERLTRIPPNLIRLPERVPKRPAWQQASTNLLSPIHDRVTVIDWILPVKVDQILHLSKYLTLRLHFLVWSEVLLRRPILPLCSWHHPWEKRLSKFLDSWKRVEEMSRAWSKKGSILPYLSLEYRGNNWTCPFLIEGKMIVNGLSVRPCKMQTDRWCSDLASQSTLPAFFQKDMYTADPTIKVSVVAVAIDHVVTWAKLGSVRSTGRMDENVKWAVCWLTKAKTKVPRLSKNPDRICIQST